jgi:N-acetyl-gamma-glutamyl-phosphate reductase
VNEAPQPLEGDPAARVVVAGASGFAGALAAQLLWDHPRLELVELTSRSDAGTRLDRLYPRYRVPLELRELDLGGLDDIDAAIVAYPHAASAPVVAEMSGLGIAVVDLSADFRLRDIAVYEKWYGPHSEPALLEGAAYGLPELHREQIRAAELVANPGCYPTAALLALAPLAEQGLVADLVIDAKQGISGAGRGGGDEMHFVTLAENAFAYKVDAHRHTPEIEQELQEIMPAASSANSEPQGERSAGLRPAAGPAGSLPFQVTFVPHLLPLDQGELVNCYVTPTREVDAAELRELYEQRYAQEPFVRLTDRPPGVRDVRDSNECHVYVTHSGPRLVALAAIDNLWKGAASQAVQNLNLMLGLGETEGLR